MDGLEKIEIAKMPAEEQEEGKLYKEALASKPTFSSNAEAIAQLTQDLDQLAEKENLSVSDLLERAERSAVFNETDSLAMSLARRISFLKK